MNGSPAKMGTISGTAGHSSVLKMRAEENAASALKQKYTYKNKKGERVAVPKEGLDATGVPSGQFKGLASDKATDAVWKKGQDKAKSSGVDLDALVKTRKGLKKGSDEYNVVQNQINKALGSKKVHGATSSVETKDNTTTTVSNKPGVSSNVASTKTTRGGRKKVTTKRYEDNEGITTRKYKTIADKEGDIKRSKTVIKSDYDKDDTVDKKTKIKTKYNKDGTVKKTKRVTKEGGRRTVTKTDKEGNVTTKSRRTIKGWLTGKGKKKKEE